LNYERTVLDELSRDVEGTTMTEIRSLLGAVLFSGDDVNKRVVVLSGGERARLGLAKVIAQRNNCLLLDEPTNNLDIVAKETLLEALRRFPGTVVIVSHDRYILNQLVSEVIEVGHGHAVRYLGNYDRYLAKKETEGVNPGGAPANKSAPMRTPANGDNDFSAAVQNDGDTGASDASNGRGGAGSARASRNDSAIKADREAQRNKVRVAKERAGLESEIEKKETERAALATEMNDPNFYLIRRDANEMIARYDRLGREIERLYTQLVGTEDSETIR
jgi:ATP-binding cassette subfamily F protein 3